VEEAPEGGYTAPALGLSIYTEADSWDELKTAVQDAVQYVRILALMNLDPRPQSTDSILYPSFRKFDQTMPS
jgi:hypothetical protein